MDPRPGRSSSVRGCPRLPRGLGVGALLLATAVGCGSDVGRSAGDGPDPTTGSSTGYTTGATSQSQTPSSGSGTRLAVGDTVKRGQAVVVSASNVDGETSVRARLLGNDRALDRFLAGVDARLATRVRATAVEARVPPGSKLFGAVVSVGCDEPIAVTWWYADPGVRVRPTLPKTRVQCLVPVTSVALFLVPR